MRKLLPLLFLALALPAFAQTTYTTTADGCGAKNLGFCVLNVLDNEPTPQAFTLTLDTRYAGNTQINTLAVSQVGVQVFSVHGAYAGFVANPNGTHAAYYSGPNNPGMFLSDDGTVAGTFPFYAYYVGTCSGRGCGPVVVGWHYRVLAGSTVTRE